MNHRYLLTTFILLSFCIKAEQSTPNKTPEVAPENHNVTVDSQTTKAEQEVNASHKGEPIKTLVFAPAPPSEYVQKKQLLSQQFRRDLPTQEEAKKSYKERKKRFALKNWLNEPRKENLTISQMNFQQLLQRKNELLLEGNYETALKYLEKMFKLTEHADQLVYIMLEWAELLMKTGQYAKAEKLFDEFIKLYPGNEYVEQAFVKAIECSWMQTSNFDRDQTKTESTLKLIDQFETRNTLYAQENIDRIMHVKEMCQQKLADSNLYVAKHYIGRGVYRSAHKRLDDARKNDLQVRPNIEPRLLQLEIELAQAEKKDDVEQQKIGELVEKFPEHEITLAFKPELVQKTATI